MNELIGPFVLGHLDEKETVALQAHLEGCKTCHREAEDLRRTAALLHLADPLRSESRPPVSPQLEDRVFGRIDRERNVSNTRKRRIRRWSMGVAAAALTAGALMLPSIGRDTTDTTTVQIEAREVSVRATLQPRPWGTQIQLSATGLDPERYSVWLKDEDGLRVPAGTFAAVPGKDLLVTLASALPLDRAVMIGMSNEDGSIELTRTLGD